MIVPQRTIRLGLGGILIITGVRLLDKHLLNRAFGSIFGTLAAVVIVDTAVAMRAMRAVPERA